MTRSKGCRTGALAVSAVAFTFACAVTAAGQAQDDQITACLKAADLDRSQALLCIGPISQACMKAESVTSAIEAATCVEAETAAWDQLLNQTYGEKIAEAQAKDASDTEPDGVEENLRAAQRAWIAFRDAECEWWGNLTTGTARFTDAATCLRNLTARRALDLLGYGAPL